jgi:hypothetical protein
MNFVKFVLENGGSIHSLIIPPVDLRGPSLTNPSVYLDGEKLWVNLRNINYTLYHSEKKKFEHHWGPLVYIHPENDLHLRTHNIMCEMNEDLTIKSYHHVDTTALDKPPLWEFVGLEDSRIVRWDGKLYLTGVRRDTTTNGQGRMELSELEVSENGVKEVSRFRVPSPGNDDSYCEKNWIPILDMPYHYIKWSNGTEIVRVDMQKGTCETVVLKSWKDMGCVDLRGGSQVLSYNGYRFCVNHETFLFNSKQGRKDGTYRHRFVVWDNDWNLVKVSEQFSFMEAEIEFAVGMAEYGDNYLITFGYQDNAAYILRVPKKVLYSFVFGE